MRTDPTQSQTTHTLTSDLESAAWIMASARRPQLFSVQIWEHKEEACMACTFINEADYQFDFLEFLRIKREQPELFRETVSIGMAKLTAYLNQLMRDQRNIPTLNTETESREQEDLKETTGVVHQNGGR